MLIWRYTGYIIVRHIAIIVGIWRDSPVAECQEILSTVPFLTVYIGAIEYARNRNLLVHNYTVLARTHSRKRYLLLRGRWPIFHLAHPFDRCYNNLITSCRQAIARSWTEIIRMAAILGDHQYPRGTPSNRKRPAAPLLRTVFPPLTSSNVSVRSHKTWQLDMIGRKMAS